jgi:hypothetical protein
MRVKGRSKVGLILIAMCIVVVIWTLYQRLDRQDLASTGSRYFDARNIQPGDRSAGLQVQQITAGTYGVNSYTVIFTGPVQLKGTYQYTTLESDYNPRQVLFIPDQESVGKLPKPTILKESATRFSLDFSQSEGASQFGVPGSTGTAEIVISRYGSVQADILEGVSDSALLERVLDIKVTPPPKPEEVNSDFNVGMTSYPKLQLNIEIEDPGDFEKIWLWLLTVEKTYVNGMLYNGKPISSAQREQVKNWLLQVFIEERVKELLDEYVAPTDGGYLISGGSLGLQPHFELKEIKDIKLTKEQQGVYRYEAKLIARSGMHDAILMCKLVWMDNGWKIAESGYKLI